VGVFCCARPASQPSSVAVAVALKELTGMIALWKLQAGLRLFVLVVC
jgi:hypothetical protein